MRNEIEFNKKKLSVKSDKKISPQHNKDTLLENIKQNIGQDDNWERFNRLMIEGKTFQLEKP